MASLNILYFAWARDRLGCSAESVRPPPQVATVGALRTWMRSRGPQYAELFAEGGGLRAAVNQDFAGDDAAVAPGDEIAFFPPVTGG